MGSIIENEVDDFAFDEDSTTKTAVAPAMRKATVKQVASAHDDEFDESIKRMSARHSNRAITTKQSGQ